MRFLDKCFFSSASSSSRQAELNNDIVLEEIYKGTAEDNSAKAKSYKKLRNSFIEENAKCDEVDMERKLVRHAKDTKPKMSYQMEQAKSQHVMKSLDQLNFATKPSQVGYNFDNLTDHYYKRLKSFC